MEGGAKRRPYVIYKMRINRALALTGLCSRRKADLLIESGRVMVNGKTVTEYNHDVDFEIDSIAVDGKPLHLRSYQYLILHKPKDVLTTCDDPQGRSTVIDILP